LVSGNPDQVGIIRATSVCGEVPVFGGTKAQDMAIQEQKIRAATVEVGVNKRPSPDRQFAL
jgi:hypothetical protein